MTTSTSLPELIITLSRDRVRVELAQPQEGDGQRWQFTHPIQGTFFGDQVSTALDNALMQNPSLMDQFEQVEVVLVDSPAIFIPRFYQDQKHLLQIADKYLRRRRGDTLSMDVASGGSMFVYNLPTDTIHVLREYYANAGHLHMAAMLWNNLVEHVAFPSSQVTGIYFTLIGNSLIVLGKSGGKLVFSKCFTIQDKGDLLYFLVACSRLFPSGEYCQVNIKHESSRYLFPEDTYFSFHHRLELPDLRTLISHHRLCES